MLLLFAGINAQNGTGTSGGDAEADIYKVSYSMGQCFYTATSQSAHYISSGIQHPFMLISIETDIEKDAANPELLAYPNPVMDWLRVMIEDPELKDLTCILMDASGKKVLMKKIEDSEMIISMKDRSPGIYFLNIYSKAGIIKSFKLIKQ